ncbi:actin binding Rho activating protein b [Chanos chanos]|uniref:Actin-binding Rho-activating protein n=1 Tax=Chanos chanos TaxID=29144 RepID=A0A6J2WPR1_CHACN|nr:actin-binding Rho-activating protein [Chanos chanos]
MSETARADTGPRKASVNKNIKKLRTISMVCSLARSWQQWVSENEEKQANEPSGWAPASLDDPGDARKPTQAGGQKPAEKPRPVQAAKSQAPETESSEGDPTAESRIKTKQVVKTVKREAQERSAGIEFLTHRICKDPAEEELDKMLNKRSSPTRRRKCSNMVSELKKSLNVAEKKKKQGGEDGEDGGISEEEDGGSEKPGEDENDDSSWNKIKRASVIGTKTEGEDASKLNQISKNYSAVGNLKSRWQSWASEHSTNQKLNPFSEDFDYDYSMSTRLRKGDEGYGRPKEGSKTAERARRAEAHIQREIDHLCFVIRTMTDPDPDGLTRVTFGELFDRYVRISDKVVGILMRARKHGKVAFEGEMLWQGQDDGVIITLLV